MRKKLNIAKEREHIILWRKMNKNLREVYRKPNLNTKGNGQSPTNSKATYGGRSSRISQEPQRTSTDSADESEETCYIICEGSTQAIDATSSLDMSVGI